MFAQSMSYKQKPRKMPSSVTQGSRIIGKTGGRPAQIFVSEKSTHGSCPVESPLEKVIGQLAGLDPRVRTVRPQPFTVDVVSGSILYTREDLVAHRKTRERSEVSLREYTPDFGFRLLDGVQIAIEVKDRRFPCKQEYWDKIDKAKRILAAHGYRFQVIFMNYEPSDSLVHNADILTALRINFEKNISQNQIDAIEAGVGDSASTLGQVAHLADLTLREAPALVLQGVVAADLAAGPLGSRTLVQLAYGDLAHLAVLNFEGNQV